MLTDKPMKIRLAFSLGSLAGFIGVLYLETWIMFWFPGQITADLFIMSGLGGAFFWSWTLPHPRQERKQREKLERLKQAQELSQLSSSLVLVDEKETLAEKRP